MKQINLSMLVLLISVGIGLSQGSADQSTSPGLKPASSSLGLCIYSVDTEPCPANPLILETFKDELERGEAFYFELDRDWANKRIEDWAAKHESKPVDYIMLFDLDQGFEKRSPTAWPTAFQRFAVLDKRLQYEILLIQNEVGSAIKITTNEEKTMLSNSMWREFMTGRLGTLEDSLEISFSAENPKEAFEQFKAELMKALE